MEKKEYQTLLDELKLESEKSYSIDGIIYLSDYPFEKIYNISLIENYKENMSVDEMELVNILVKKIEENVLSTFKNVLNYVNKFLYTEEFVKSDNFVRICKLIGKVTCFYENINKLSNSSEIHKVADKILELFKNNVHIINKNMIYAESLFKDIIKVSSNQNQINPMNTTSIDYTITKFGVKWEIKIYGNEMELTNNKDIRCSLNKNNMLLINFKPMPSYDGTTSYYAYFVFKLDDSTFAVFDNNLVNQKYVNDIIVWASKNDVNITYNDWTTNHPLKGGFNGLTYVDYFGDSKNGKKTGVGMVVLGVILFIIAIEAYLLCNLFEKKVLGIILAIAFSIFAIKVIASSKIISNK